MSNNKGITLTGLAALLGSLATLIGAVVAILTYFDNRRASQFPPKEPSDSQSPSPTQTVRTPSISSPFPSPITPEPDQSPAPIITRPEYDAIHNGMTYAQVVEVIGSPGEDAGSNGPFTFYEWDNETFFEVRMVFKDGVLTSKGSYKF